MGTKLSNLISVDIGSSKIAVIASYIENNSLINIVSQGFYYSTGIKSGIITDFKKVENSLVSAVYNLEKDLGKTINVLLFLYQMLEQNLTILIAKLKLRHNM
ncbi:cell division FtsA family protein [Orientia chuto str. Dubai]|uniref:Cell division FtsA family protein n=1 Tax=Orientia chuto str. Dubai TaxID=1359168 RepID=A0A0F3MIX7_9RICK|nr:hypothetical protein [Candidatus Orientia mediorientalis]KJV55437.1 cell division FtsA family protein [Orientia chuto str. Dubai]